MSAFHRESIVLRWLCAAGVILGPLCFFALPAILFPTEFETAEEMFAAAVNRPPKYTPLFLQIAGALFWLLGAYGVMGVLRGRRGRVPGRIGSVLVMLGGLSALPVIGIELAQVFILDQGADPAESIRLALALNNWSPFNLLLMITLAGLFLGTLLQLIGLVRGRIVPVWSLLFLLLPVIVNFLPLPLSLANILGGLGLVVPLLWIAAAMVRPEPSLAIAPQAA